MSKLGKVPWGREGVKAVFRLLGLVLRLQSADPGRSYLAVKSLCHPTRTPAQGTAVRERMAAVPAGTPTAEERPAEK